MWKYGGLTDPDHASSEELLNDEVWSCLDRVLQLKPKERVDGARTSQLLGGVQTGMLPLFTPCSFPLCFPFFYFESPVL